MWIERETDVERQLQTERQRDRGRQSVQTVRRETIETAKKSSEQQERTESGSHTDR